MRTYQFGILVGVLLALTAIFGGFGGLVLAVVLGAIGGVVGAHFGGDIDVRRAFDSVNSRGRG